MTPRFFLLISLMAACLVGCQRTAEPGAETSAPTDGTFQNPILAGFNPDPSICRVGEDYYLTTSTFGYFPGLPILHSKDLVNWEQIGAVLDTNQQMNLDEQRITRGFFAPAITHHDGWFYVICTLIDGYGNFVSRTQDPAGPWSDPIWLPELNGGIDPSLFFDDDRVYVVYNLGPPNNEPLYSGHRTIRMRELDPNTFKPIGEERLLVNGGSDISQEPVWIEAPHIYKTKGYYYLMCAEGGTAYNHSEVVFRAKNLTDDFVPYENNPIITARTLDPDRPNPITTVGHADMVELPSGEWWAVFLACRPYEGNHFNTGRETFLAPVEWTEDGWPVINPDFEAVQYEYPLPNTGATSPSPVPLNGEFTYRIDFDEPLDNRWMFLRNVRRPWYELNTEVGNVALELRPEAIDIRDNPSLMLRRQTHLNGSFATHLDFTPESANEQAGVVILQSETHYYFVNKTVDQLRLLKQTENGQEVLAEVPYTDEGVHLKVEAHEDVYNFLYSENGETYDSLADGVDAKYLSTETAGGFTGCMYGLYATARGESSSNSAVFDYVEIVNE
ncbi:alpha-N-arabinofuranosidase [Neolewinella xylanilytica]|uniref:Alpha-N-arabinofuranosidase n=1 Tax=Neolewinella xylanilytica TaxID=1514080 RepID=A0A2S6I1F5_9BACT|nr:glycoside hydrolase family 43 protein [Neolewinella xylanilytica]PPK84799.1 alpha-N-arabinofuranosidase [Neolewinella xylanilytica]